MRGAGRARAVIDIGSNSGRVVVFRTVGDGLAEILGDSSAPLRLIREFDAGHRLTARGIERTLQVLRDFRSVAAGAGAARTFAVATAAVREAVNGRELLRRIQRDTGLRVEILDAAREARFAFLGAVFGLPVHDGLLLDLGGGSLQIVQFRDRRLVRSWSLPLGALRLSDRFLSGRRPGPGGVRKLQAHVAGRLARAGVPSLRRGGTFLGTGGTVRNLAKIDGRRRGHPILRLHGYEIGRSGIEEMASLLARQRRSSLGSIPGLNADRADSIAGGCLIVESVMDAIGADRLLVSGLGLREGILLDGPGRRLPAVGSVRRASIADLTSRFTSWDAGRARGRAALADRLLRRLDPASGREMREMLHHAATVLDIGRSIDYYRRHEHSAMILRSTDLMGFTHRETGLIAAIIELADDERRSLKRYMPLLVGTDRGAVTRAGIVLALADEIERRLPPGRPAPVRCRVAEEAVTISSSALAAWRPRSLAERFRKAFGLAIRFRAPRA